MDISKLKVVDLKKELKSRGLSTIGTKNELMERLQEAIQDDEVGDNAALDNDDLLDEEAVLADESDEAVLEGNPIDEAAIDLVPKPSPSKIESVKPEVQVQKKIILNRNPSVATPVTEDLSTDEKKEENGTDESKKVVKLANPLTNEERAKLRAQKFGVAVPDSLKKAVRAERFGSTTTTAPVAKISSDDQEKLLKRQARFGIVDKSVEVDEKKKKRAEKFGTTTTTTTSNPANDELKRKRAERFGLVV